MKANCKNCSYCHHAGMNAYVCGRYPPAIFAVQNGSPTSAFPPVHPEFKCGEWKQKLQLDDVSDLTSIKN